jgi:CSLREA domain-containing protein
MEATHILCKFAKEESVQRVLCAISVISGILLRIAWILLAVAAGLAVPLETSAAPPATHAVTKLADTDDSICDAACSLREAIAAAAPNDSIDFAPGLTGTITLGSTLIISKNVAINGPATHSIIISGNDAVRVFYVEFGVLFTIRNLTITKGYIKGTHGSNAEKCYSGDAGGEAQGCGLFNRGGAVAILNCTFSDNRAVGGAGGSGSAWYPSGNPYSSPCARGGSGGNGGYGIGGALFNLGKMFLVNSTFSGNKASGGKGGPGGQYTYGRSGAITGPGAHGGNGMGGALYSANEASVINCTFADNAVSGATYGLGQPHGIVGAGLGGAIYSAGSVSIQNSIIADNPAGGNCRAPISSGGYNLDSDGTCGLNAPGDLSKFSPKLGHLKNNGGSTFTHALLPGSPAVDAGDPTGCRDHNGALIATDQRGRKRDKKCDIGAFEYSR